MNKMERKMLLLFGEKDRIYTHKLLAEYLGLTMDSERKKMIVNVINVVKGFRSDAEFMSFMEELRKEDRADAADEV